MKNSMNVLFLDIDGVLNGYATKDRIGRIPGISSEKVALLAEIVNLLDCEIVLSSSWKAYWSKDLLYDGVDNWLGCSPKRYGRYINFKLAEHGLMVFDKTIDVNWSDRALEIKHYLSTRDVDDYIILDDEDFAWRRHGLADKWLSTAEDEAEWYLRYPGLLPKHIDEVKERWLNGSNA